MRVDFSLLDIALYAPYFWFAFGSLLLSAELLGGAGYLLWLGISAWLVMLLSWLIPTLNWLGLWISFCFGSLSIILLWHYGQRQGSIPPIRQTLNQPQKQLLGYQGILEDDLIHGVGRLPINDSSWRVKAEQSLLAGTQVIVTGIKGNTLQIKAVENAENVIAP